MMPPGATIGEALRAARLRLAAIAGPDAGLEARRLAEAALGRGAASLLTDADEPVEAEEGARLEAFVARRLAAEPVARIIGEAEFWGLPFRLSPATLVPRPDTEAVVAAALRLAPADPLSLLDLGTGTGCLLVALLHERPAWHGLGIDRSAEAARTARANAERNGVSSRAAFAVADWAAPVGGRVDLVVSNPPYIASAVLPGLAPEVREHDPVLALDGGPNGLDAYRRILSDAARLLVPGGLGILEIGFDQGRSVPALVAEAGLDLLGIEPDLAGRDRVVGFRKPS